MSTLGGKWSKLDDRPTLPGRHFGDGGLSVLLLFL